MQHKTTARIAPPMNIRVDMVIDKPKMIESSSSLKSSAAAVSDSSFVFPFGSGFKTSPIYFRTSAMSTLVEEFS